MRILYQNEVKTLYFAEIDGFTYIVYYTMNIHIKWQRLYIRFEEKSILFSFSNFKTNLPDVLNHAEEVIVTSSLPN